MPSTRPKMVGGDPLELRLGEGDVVDAQLVLARRWPEHEWLEGLGGELLEGLNFDAAPRFADWLDLERHHLREPPWRCWSSWQSPAARPATIVLRLTLRCERSSWTSSTRAITPCWFARSSARGDDVAAGG